MHGRLISGDFKQLYLKYIHEDCCVCERFSCLCQNQTCVHITRRKVSGKEWTKGNDMEGDFHLIISSSKWRYEQQQINKQTNSSGCAQQKKTFVSFSEV